MIVRAQQSKFPYILLAAMVAVSIYALFSVFMRTADFSISGITTILVALALVISPAYFLAMNFKQGQSVELTDDGVWSLVWLKPTRARLWPKLEKTLLKWTDIQRWMIRGNVIYLYGPQHQVLINTIYFKDANEVIRFINFSTKAT